MTKLSLLWMLTCGLALMGCSHGTPPTSLITQTEVTVRDVEQSDTMRIAPLEVRQARENLDLAKKAMVEKNYVAARRMAERSMADAELARAKTDAEKTRINAEESTKTMDALRRETNRNLSQ